MYWPEVATFQHFYDSAAGQAVRSRIEEKIALLWPDLTEETLLGLGYPGPYVERFRGSSNTVALCMPAAQGITYWPDKGHNQACLVQESCLPFRDNSIHRVIIAHTLEYTEHPKAVMREIWRVLAPGGKLLLIVPNRLSIWAHMGKTPFASGHAFHMFEITAMMQETLFLPCYTASLLFTPAVFPTLMMKASLLENLGTIWLQPFGGVVLAEGEKQLYAASSATSGKRKSPRRIWMPAVG